MRYEFWDKLSWALLAFSVLWLVVSMYLAVWINCDIATICYPASSISVFLGFIAAVIAFKSIK